MRPLFTSPALFGPGGVYGGGERYAHQLALAVARQVGGATLLAAAERQVDRHEGALRIVARPPWRWVSGQRFNPLPRGLVEAMRSSDVGHCFQQHITMTSAALALGRLLRKPVFVTDLGGGGWDISAWVDTSRWATGLLHISRYAAMLAGREARGEDSVLYGGADTAAPARGGGSQVLFVGRLLPHKGPDTLIEAARPEWDVHLVGAPQDPRFLDELRALAGGKRVTFTHQAGDDELEAAYAQAAVVVVPSRPRDRYGNATPVAELLGLVAIEAAVRGIPVVASDSASLPEVVAHGETGFLVPSAEPGPLRARVDQLLGDAELRRAMGAAARSRALERFTWEAAAVVAVSAYERARNAR